MRPEVRGTPQSRCVAIRDLFSSVSLAPAVALEIGLMKRQGLESGSVTGGAADSPVPELKSEDLGVPQVKTESD